ncbi:16242_t:CDS:2, partial [Acaulospora colombiana]
VFFDGSPRENFLSKEWIDPTKDKSLYQNVTRANAVIVVLVRNNEIHQIRSSMRQFEDRWNKKFNYPYVFLNDEEFTEEFKRLTSSITNSQTQYGLIPKQMWSYPDWIDQEKAAKARKEMESNNVIYGGSESYRHMLEPSVEFMCDVDYDPFLFMKKNKLIYGFTITILEFEATIPTLWKTVKEFTKEYPQYVAKDNIMNFISNDNGETYNL